MQDLSITLRKKRFDILWAIFKPRQCKVFYKIWTVEWPSMLFSFPENGERGNPLFREKVEKAGFIENKASA